MGDSHGLQQGNGELAHRHLADYALPPPAPVADDHEQRNSIKHIHRGQGIDAISQARVLHEQGGPATSHPGSGADPHSLLLSGSGQMNDIRVGVNQSQKLLKVDAWHRRGEIDAGANQAQIDGPAWIHINIIAPPGH